MAERDRFPGRCYSVIGWSSYVSLAICSRHVAASEQGNRAADSQMAKSLPSQPNLQRSTRWEIIAPRSSQEENALGLDRARTKSIRSIHLAR